MMISGCCSRYYVAGERHRGQWNSVLCSHSKQGMKQRVRSFSGPHEVPRSLPDKLREGVNTGRLKAHALSGMAIGMDSCKIASEQMKYTNYVNNNIHNTYISRFSRGTCKAKSNLYKGVKRGMWMHLCIHLDYSRSRL